MLNRFGTTISSYYVVTNFHLSYSFWLSTSQEFKFLLRTQVYTSEVGCVYLCDSPKQRNLELIMMTVVESTHES